MLDLASALLQDRCHPRLHYDQGYSNPHSNILLCISDTLIRILEGILVQASTVSILLVQA
jgi:hypothetical protein